MHYPRPFFLYRMVSIISLCLIATASQAAVRRTLDVGMSGTQVDEIVTLSYTTADSGRTLTAHTNTATFVIPNAPAAGVAVTPATASQDAAPGAKACDFPVVVRNTGAASDQFDLALSAPAGWAARLVRDVNGDGVRQAGETAAVSSPLSLDPGQSLSGILVVTLPAKTDGNTQSVTLRLTSRADPAQSAAATASVTTAAPLLSVTPVADALRVAWTVRTGGPVLGGTTIKNGTAFVGSDDGGLYAIAAAGDGAGTVAWRTDTGGRVRCTPAVYTVADGRTLVTVGNDSGVLTTLNAATGQILWVRSLGPWRQPSWRSRPLVSSDGALVTVPDGQASLRSYRTTDGTLMLRHPYRGLSVGDPMVSGPDGRAWMIGANGWGLEIVNGSLLRGLLLGAQTLAGLTLDAGTASLTAITASGRVVAYDPNTLQPNPRWKTLTAARAQADTDTTAIVPDGPGPDGPSLMQPESTGPSGINLGAPVETSPGLDPAGGTMYVGAASHKVWAVGTLDGSLRGAPWPLAPAGPGRFLSQPLAWPTVGGGASTLYLGDTAGVFYAVPTDHPDRALSFATHMGGADADAGGEWDANPAASGTTAGDVVVAGNTNGLIYGFALR